jgi:hypothetical protein
MVPKEISQTSIPNPKYTVDFRKGIKTSSGHIRYYEFPVLLKFHNSIWKYVYM